MSRKATLSRRTVLAGIATAGVASGLGSRNSFAQSGTEVSYNTFLDPANANDPRCLLYTSPSPRDGLLSRMPSSA